MKKILLLLLTCLLVLTACNQVNKSIPAKRPVSIILDTDIGPDYDDVGAIAFLHAAADSGSIKLLGTISCNRDSLTGPTLEIINSWYGRAELPLGAPKGIGVCMGSEQHWPDSLAARFMHAVNHTGQLQNATTVYRRLLAQQPDTSVTLVTVGFLTNMAALLQSGPDSISPLTGLELVGRKVRQLVSMAGAFPSGREFNVYMDSTAARYTFSQWPTPVIFSGFEIGEKVRTGGRLIQSAGKDNPVREAFRIAMQVSREDVKGRMSWDQTAVLVAVGGTEPYFSVKKGKIIINSDGSNGWQDDPAGKQAYILFKTSPDTIADYIERKMEQAPASRKNPVTKQ